MEHPDRRRREDGRLTTGWRYWQLAPNTGRLHSVSLKRVVWAPDQPVRAFCVVGRHPSPDERCNCGLYAAPDLETLRRHRLCLPPDALVVGEVALWGRVVRAEDGYRGEYAYPMALSLVLETASKGETEGLLQTLSAYGGPVGTMRLEEAVGEVARAVMANQAMSARTR